MEFFIAWIVLIELLGLLALPPVWAIFARRPSRGVPYASSFGLICVGLLTWLPPALHLIPYTRALIIGSLAMVGLVSWLGWGRLLVGELRRLRGPDLLSILLPEAIFIGASIWQAHILSLNPSLYVSEKPMNFAFTNAVSTSDWFPPGDPWLAGYPINYYYFGHLLVASLTRLSGVPTGISFSLAAVTFFASVAKLIVALTLDIGGANRGQPGRRRPHVLLICGLGALLMALFSGNLAPVQQALGNPALLDTWWQSGEPGWWSPPYYAHGSLSELPWRTFAMNQLHSSDLALPGLLLTLAWLASWWDHRSQAAHSAGKRALQHGSLALVLAGTALASPWVFYPCALLCVTLAAQDIYAAGKAAAGTGARLRAVARPALAWCATAAGVLLLLGIFASSYRAPAQLLDFNRETLVRLPLQTFLLQFGVKLIGIASILLWHLSEARPPARRLLPLLLLGLLPATGVVGWSATLALSIWLSLVLLAIRQYRRQGRLSFALLLLCLSQTLDTLPFLIVIHDIDNTFYKFGLLAWLISAIAIFAELGRLAGAGADQGRLRRLVRGAVPIAVGSGLLLGALMPAIALISITNRFQGWGTRTLDGAQFHLSLTQPPEAGAVAWLLASAPPQALVLEAAGPSFSRAARVATTTGRPTLLGWRQHEQLWHEQEPALLQEVQRREQAVTRLYRTTEANEARCLLERYNIDYVFVGEVERALIAADPSLEPHNQERAVLKFAEFMERVYPPQAGAATGAIIYKRRALPPPSCL